MAGAGLRRKRGRILRRERHEGAGGEQGGFLGLNLEEKRMSRQWFLGGASIACLIGAVITGAMAQSASPPDFSSNGAGWQTANGGEFGAVPGSPGPMRQDPGHPYVGNGQGKQPTYRIGDIANPNL